tara:strand:+ start:4825 stop:5616 length:792 start_codon:yes stop_codon:yes gene_type:complete
MTAFDNTIPIKPTDFTPSLHAPYAKIKSHANGGKYIWAKAKVKVPPMRLAFDYNEHDDDRTGRKKYDMSLSFMGSDSNVKIQTFLDMCKTLDKYNIEWACANSTDLWGEDLSAPEKRVVVEDRYTSMIKMPKKSEYSPTFKVKLMTNYNTGKNEFQVFSNTKDPETGAFPEIEIWNEEEAQLDLSVFKAKTEMATLIEYTGMWVVGKKMYPGWKLVQCQPKSFGQQEKKFALADSDDEGEDPPDGGGDEVEQILDRGEDAFED